MTKPVSDCALDAFLHCWFDDLGKTGGLDRDQIARYRHILIRALDAMETAERRHFAPSLS